MNKCGGGNIFVFDVSIEEAQSKDYSRFYNEMDLPDGEDYWEVCPFRVPRRRV